MINVVYYALPLYLGKGELFNYANNILECILHFSDICGKIIYDENLNLGQSYEDILKHPNLAESILNNSIVTKTDLLPCSKNYMCRNYTSDIDPFNNIKIYHCIHNGFSINNSIKCRKVINIYTTLPLSEPDNIDSNFILKYLQSLKNNALENSHIIVPYHFMKEDISLILNDYKNIHVIQPGLSLNQIGESKILSKAYVLSKFNISNNYYLYIGEINERNDLIDTIKLFKHYNENSNAKLLLSLNYLNKNKKYYLDLLKFIDKSGLSNDVIFLTNLSKIDSMNLLNAALCFINLNNYDEINLTLVQAAILNTKILSYPSRSVFEYFEDLPIYIANYLDAIDYTFEKKEFFELTSEYKNNLLRIIKKFDLNDIRKKYMSIYSNLI